MTQRYIGGLIYNPPGGYSGYFNGSSSYLSAPDNAAWYFTGDFTVECWAYWNNTSSSEANVLAQHRPASSANQAINFYSDTTTLYFVYNSSSVSTKIAAGQWYHLAMSCTSGTASSYINGALVGTFSMPSRIDSADPFTIGVRTGSGGSGVTGYFPGYISNVRVINGTGIYSGSSITVPSGALQNITNTKLLTCQSATFIDNSSSPFTITNNGASVSTQNPFPLTTLPNPAQGGAGNGIFSMSQYQSLKQQNLWPTVDPYFDYTTLLLHGNGTNGGQNNTFQDSSSNNFTITRNGNTTQGTFSPFSQTGWSNYFDGSGDYLTLPSNSAFSFGTGNFTAECWVYFTSLPAANQALFDFRDANDNTSFEMGVYSNYIPFFANSSGGVLNGSFTFSVGTWYHIAFTRSGTSLNIWVNGTNAGSTTNSTNLTGTNCKIGASVSGGDNVNGYISNARVVKGTAVYTAAFTPSTSPLTAISGTSLLTCQSNRFVDNSSNAFTITVNGNTSVQAFSPFAPTAAYSASTVGGSGYFDGTGDYLSVANNTALQLGSSDWDIECWVYLTTTISGAQRIISQADSNYEFAYYLSNMALTAYSFQSGGTQNFAISMGTLTTGQWYHLATTRSGSNIRSFINGTQVGTATFSGTIDARTGGWNFGASYAPSEYLNGYISSARIVKGSAVYTSAFTPPTAPLTNITNTSLLLNFTNAAIIDNTAKNVLETVGNAQISTTQSKFGGASLYFDGTGDYLVGRTTDLLSFNTGDFTVEMWVYPNSVAGNIVLIDTRASGTDSGWAFYINSSSKLALFTSNADRITAGSALSASTWTHVVLARSGSTLAIYMNGVQSATATYSTTMTCPGRISIASGFDNAAPLNGYIDDLRITKGIARYTANFTPQTSQWQDQ